MLKTFTESKGMEASSKPEAASHFVTARGKHKADKKKKKVSHPNARKDNFQISLPDFL